MNYWLFKSEPSTFSIDDLAKRPRQTEHWDGVRNYQVRNMMRDEMKKGDLGFFYHSSCPVPGIAGVVEIVKEGYPDHTSSELDSSKNPRWYMVDVKLVEKFPRLVSLDEIKKNPKLKSMLINRKGNRLSITPVTVDEWKEIANRARTQ